MKQIYIQRTIEYIVLVGKSKRQHIILLDIFSSDIYKITSLKLR